MGRKPLPKQEKERRDKARKSERVKKHRELIEAGLCRQCGKPRSNKSNIFCDMHSRRNNENCKNYLIAQGYGARKYYKMLTSAKQRNIEFDMSKDQFVAWLDAEPKQCYYCGVDECLLENHYDLKQRKLTVDRKDNNERYHKGNMCLACFRCNNMKSNFFTAEDWTAIAEKFIKPRITEYHGLGT